MKPWRSLESKTIWVTGGAGYLCSAITVNEGHTAKKSSP